MERSTTVYALSYPLIGNESTPKMDLIWSINDSIGILLFEDTTVLMQIHRSQPVLTCPAEVFLYL